jgi:hypothetical protein
MNGRDSCVKLPRSYPRAAMLMPAVPYSSLLRMLARFRCMRRGEPSSPSLPLRDARCPGTDVQPRQQPPCVIVCHPMMATNSEYIAELDESWMPCFCQRPMAPDDVVCLAAFSDSNDRHVNLAKHITHQKSYPSMSLAHHVSTATLLFLPLSHPPLC